MSIRNLTTFSRRNGRLILFLIASHLLWSGLVLLLWAVGQKMETALIWWSMGFIALQLFAAGQLLLPALLLHPEERSRSFYFFWGIVLALLIWLVNQLPPLTSWQPLLSVIKSGLLLLAGTVIGAALARYVNRLWELIPICLVMTLADFSSWLIGPTANFAQEIQTYYLTPQGPPPPIDMLLVKMAFPGAAGLAPVFGISDWIMVVFFVGAALGGVAGLIFFVNVARRYRINDNLIGAPGETLAQQKRAGCYLPLPLAALFAAILLAQTSGHFVPALPLIVLIMLLWYLGRLLLRHSRETS